MKILKIHKILGFCYEIMSFRDLLRYFVIAQEPSRSNLQHHETNFVPFSYTAEEIRCAFDDNYVIILLISS